MARSATTLGSINSRSNSSALQPRPNAAACSAASCSASRVPAGNTRDVDASDNQLSHAQGEMTKNGIVIAAAECLPPPDVHPHPLDKPPSPDPSNRQPPPPLSHPPRSPYPA